MIQSKRVQSRASGGFIAAGNIATILKIRPSGYKPAARLSWQSLFRILGLLLIGTMTLICHPCHGEDMDDELSTRDWWVTSSR